MLDAINATGYGLTFGVHSRIDETIAQVAQQVQAGNIYVIRNVIGAVVGVQPFGGIGLSGTGPKAGGPLYLYRLLQPGAAQGNAALAALPALPVSPSIPPVAIPLASDIAPLRALQSVTAALQDDDHAPLLPGEHNSADVAHTLAACHSYAAHSALGQVFTLPGPTGETNRYQLLPRGPVWAQPHTAVGLLHQLAAALASGNRCWLATPAASSPVAQTLAALPPEVLAFVEQRPAAEILAAAQLGAVLFEGDGDALQRLAAQLAQRPGALLRIESLSSAQLADGTLYDVSALMHEQSISTNTAAAGGNAQLMTMG